MPHLLQLVLFTLISESSSRSRIDFFAGDDAMMGCAAGIEIPKHPVRILKIDWLVVVRFGDTRARTQALHGLCTNA